MNSYNYKGFHVSINMRNGMFEYYSRKQLRFLKFDDLSDCYDSIDCEIEKIAPSKYTEDTAE